MDIGGNQEGILLSSAAVWEVYKTEVEESRERRERLALRNKVNAENY